MIELDAIDRKILSVLQADGNLPQREIADRVGLSQNACWRRIRRLTDTGVIAGYTTRLDTGRLGLDLTVFVLIQTSHHNADWSKSFHDEISQIDGIVDAYRIGGEWDYLLKVVTTSMSGYDRVYQELTQRVPGLDRVTGLFAMEELFSNLPLPIQAR
ncbi:MAG: Lrp/AsnC family transcriptional regulator [Pseudomonadota bacterium]